MTKLSIDSTLKTISAELDLKGELVPLAINIESYRLVVEEGTTFLEIGSVKTSREWLTNLCETNFKQRRINLGALGVPGLIIGLL